MQLLLASATSRVDYIACSYTVFGIPFLMHTYQMPVERWLSPLWCSFQGLIRKGNAYYALLPVRMHVWLAIHVVLLPLIICIDACIHRIYMFLYGTIYCRIIHYLMYSTVKQQVTLNPCCTYVHINAIYACILTSNHFCVTSDAPLWEHIGTAGAAVTKGARRTRLRDGFCIA